MLLGSPSRKEQAAAWWRVAAEVTVTGARSRQEEQDPFSALLPLGLPQAPVLREPDRKAAA